MADDSNDTTASSSHDTQLLTLHLTVTGQQGAPRVPIQVPPTISPKELRQQASEITRIPLSNLRLIFRGRLVTGDDDTIQAVKEFKLEEGSVLHCMGKPVTASNADATSTSTTSAAARVATATAASTITSTHVPLASGASAFAAPVVPSTTATADPLASALQTLRASNPPKEYATGLSTLQTLLANIVDHPMEEKYRKLKKNNPAFTRRLGGLNGGEALMKAAGFVVTPEEGGGGEEMYVMQASAEAWPKLMATREAVEAAVRETTTTAATTLSQQQQALPFAPGAAPFGMPPGVGALPPGMDDAVANLMSDPNALQAMFQDPMVQNMMQNDPRLAGNPMMRQVMDELATNPMAAQQLSQMMRDPMVRNYMSTMMTEQQQGGGFDGGGGMMPRLRPSPFRPSAPGSSGSGGAGTSSTTTSSGQQQEDDAEMTEEEMIAEAIRRSLQDSP